MSPRTVRILWALAVVSGVVLALKLAPIPVAAALGTLAGAILGANLPDRMRRRLIVRLPFLG